MNDMTNYYDELDLKYPEIAIALDKIDRCNPGKIRFIIPVLTPNMSTSKAERTTVYQNSSNLENKDTKPVVTNLTQTNYIQIELPKELCAFVGGDFHVKNVVNMEVLEDGSITINGNTSPNGGEIHTHATLYGTGYEYFNGKQTYYKGILNIVPTDEYRYIAPGSKWLVVFVGGDITKPRIIARYPND